MANDAHDDDAARVVDGCAMCKCFRGITCFLQVEVSLKLLKYNDFCLLRELGFEDHILSEQLFGLGSLKSKPRHLRELPMVYVHRCICALVRTCAD